MKRMNFQKKNENLENTIEQANDSNKKSNINNNSSSTSQSTVQESNVSQMVWVGQTGSKYHTQNCPTLKGKGHQITYNQAISEGRQPCKVCH